MKNYYIVFVIICGISLSGCAAENNSTNSNNANIEEQKPAMTKTESTFQLTCENYNFDSFSISGTYTDETSMVNYADRPEALDYQAEINAGVAEGPNFAGNYRIVDISCGDYCYQHAIIDVRNGFILDDLLLSNYGVSFSNESRLVVLNPPELLPEDVLRVPENTLTSYYELVEDANKPYITSLCEMPAVPTDTYPELSIDPEHTICLNDEDCVPIPGCHVYSCVNSSYVDEYRSNERDFCSDWTDCSAAYEPEDCICQHRICTNVNLGDKGCGFDE